MVRALRAVPLTLLLLVCAAATHATPLPTLAPSVFAAVAPETLEFTPAGSPVDSTFAEEQPSFWSGEEWMRTPFGEGLITSREQWRHGSHHRADLLIDYNRVDPFRLGVGGQLQAEDPMAPRLGGRIEYAFGRERVLYGVQIEQPIAPPGRIVVGVSAVRRTDHLDLQQVDDTENTLRVLLARYDDRDYFEREGFGGYLAWRIPDFSTVSVHLRRDEFRSLSIDSGATSLLHRGRPWRVNPSIDDGETRSVLVRLERAARADPHRHGGLYHWLEVEWADQGLGGDFQYVRALADVRSVMRLTPATTFNLRLVAGHTASGTLPRQKIFVAGGINGLRAHDLDEFRGEQLALAQGEYAIGLWRMRRGSIRAGLDALAFVDAGTAWTDPDHRWNIGDRHFATDAGVGLAAAEDRLRIYVARDLQRSKADFVVSVRLQRPF